MDPQAIAKAADILLSSKHAIALTGAGISTESGIPDFRGPQGLWKQVDPSIATIDYFMREPAKFWNFYRLTLDVILRARPNRAHEALAKLEMMGIIKFIITQNVDGLHQAAGSISVLELHGNARRAVCTLCGEEYSINDALGWVGNDGIPRCPSCRGILKPATVLFGEPVSKFPKARDIAMMSDAVLVVGSSLSVYPAAYIPLIVRQRGGEVVIINMEPTELDDIATVVIRGIAGEVLPMIVERIEHVIKERNK